LCNWYTII